jgi:nucleotide-binding universal stress UspA family protein
MKNILAAIDFSDVSTSIVNKAAQISQRFASKLWLIHVTDPDPDFIGYGTGPQTERDWRAKIIKDEHQYIQQQALELDRQGIDVTPLLIQGATAEAILKEAAKLKADLIVIGSHGHNAFYKALVGSVSAEVIRKASCPVLIIPANTID